MFKVGLSMGDDVMSGESDQIESPPYFLAVVFEIKNVFVQLGFALVVDIVEVVGCQNHRAFRPSFAANYFTNLRHDVRFGVWHILRSIKKKQNSFAIGFIEEGLYFFHGVFAH